MTTVKRHVRPEEVRQEARHTLFVEGKDDAAIDPLVLSELMAGTVRVTALGPSYHVRSAAEALHKHHPDYYFLIDRDHYDDNFVKKCWSNFPDPKSSNILVWHRRELENYFIIPEYLLQSQYLVSSEDVLKKTILDRCRKRIFIDAANRVIISVREEFKAHWIKLFKRISDFGSKDDAIKQLLENPAFPDKKKTDSKMLGKREISKRFNHILDELTGGEAKLEYGCGSWLEMLRGKAIFPTVANRCFKISDASGNPLQGPELQDELARDLVSIALENQPDDFQLLHEKISERIRSS